MEAAVQVFASVNLLVLGLSHLAQPQAWADFFQLLESKGTPGAFINGFLGLGMGSVIVAFHNVWAGLPLLLTLYGWLLIAKALVTFVHPSLALRSMRIAASSPPQKFVLPGVFLTLLGALILYHRISAVPNIAA